MESFLASLPYWQIDAIKLGPVSLQPFGILVATGVLVGAHITRKHAETLGVDDDLVRALIGWTVGVGFIGAHVFDVLFYQWSDFKSDPVLMLQIWKGISSYGGFLGAIVGYLIFRHRNKITNDLVMADLAAWAILPGFTFGRAGCATVHDHPGALSDFFLAVNFPADSYVARTYGAGSRHDLGFYELLFLIGLNIVFWAIVLTKKRRNGMAMAIVAIGYAPVRFLMEPLRLKDTDPRIVGLTFAQWVSIALLVTGIIMIVKVLKKPEEQAFSLEGIPKPKPAPTTGKKSESAAKASKPSPSSKTSGMKKKKKKKR